MKVVIRNEEGMFLSMVRGQIAFVPRKERAIVYDLKKDDVERQLNVVSAEFGGQWSWEPVGDTRCVDGLPRNEP